MLAICMQGKLRMLAVIMLGTLRMSLQKINTGLPLRCKCLARHAPIGEYQPGCSIGACGKLAGHMCR